MNHESDAGFAAFLEAAHSHRADLLRIAHARLRDRDRAEDAVSDAILKAALRRRQLKDPDRLWAWLSRIVVNQCYDQMRGAGREVVTDLQTQAEVLTDFSPHNQSLSPESRARMIEGIESILDAILSIRPLEFRDILMYFYYHNLDHQALADHFQLPMGTVKSRLARARTLLARILHERGIEAVELDRIRNLAQWPDILTDG
ncbi:MAG: sigma-70 family RNA polymerase sigma factor [Leptospiraceae bacterium]|nr:sigma-70 family RNA polymerase sigma factor [Leptospiraceae bacterium]